MNNIKHPTATARLPDLASVFPGLLGQIGRELAAGGVDSAIVALQLVAFTSLLTQGTADVSWPNGQSMPVGGNGLLVAPSGSGKSVVFKTLMAPITRILSEPALGDDLQIPPAFFVEDVTREALIQQLCEWPVAALFTDEAGQLKQLLRSAAPTLAKLLDGAPLRHARVSTGRVEMLGHRMTMLLMEQPQVFEASKALLGTNTGGVGLVNRFFVAYAAGSPTGSLMHQMGLSESVAQQYMKKAEGLLKRTVALVASKEERPTLQLSPEALKYFTGIGDEIRQCLALDARLGGMAEYATRHAERTLRLAGAFHAFEHGTEGLVEVATVKAADELGRWSLDSFFQMTYKPPQLTQAEQDAVTLEQALRQTVLSSGRPMLLLSEVRRTVPNIGITKSRFDRALPILAGQGAVSVIPFGHADWLQIHPVYQGLISH